MHSDGSRVGEHERTPRRNSTSLLVELHKDPVTGVFFSNEFEEESVRLSTVSLLKVLV